MTTKYENSLLAVLFLFVIFAGFFLWGNWEEEKANFENQKLEEIQSNTLVEEMNQLGLRAKAVSIYDVGRNEKLYGKNDAEILPMASLAKTMAVIIALTDKAKEDTISISKSSLQEEGDNSLYLDEKWQVADLSKFSLILSSNDGINALLEHNPNFLQKMNERAKKIGLMNTVFYNASGLDLDSESAGAYTTAEEANLLAMYAMRAHPDIFNSTILPDPTFRSISGLEHKTSNTNIILSKIPNLIFSKTGNTDLAGGNLTVIFINQNQRIIAITILGSTTLGRFADMEKIVTVMNSK